MEATDSMNLSSAGNGDFPFKYATDAFSLDAFQANSREDW